MRPRKPNVTREMAAVWAADLQSGMTPEQIAVKHGYHENTVKIWLKGAGIWHPDQTKNPHKDKASPLTAGEAFKAAMGSQRYTDHPRAAARHAIAEPVEWRAGPAAFRTLGGVSDPASLSMLTAHRTASGSLRA